MKTKKGHQWLKEMPEDIQKRFINNMRYQNGSTFNDEYYKEWYESFHDFIIHSFTWAKTPEGYLFWENVSAKRYYEARTFLKLN